MRVDYRFDTTETERAFRYLSTNINPVLTRAINNICDKIQATARSSHRFTSRSGRLERDGIGIKEATVDSLSGKVFLNENAVVDPETGAHYARFVHEGTKPHDIFPKNKKMLKFVTTPNTARWRPNPYWRFHEGDFTYAFGVSHPGTRPDRFIHKAVNKERMNAFSLLDQAMEQFIHKCEGG